MKDSALYEALQALEAWEMRQFRLRLESPCYNRKASLLHLFDYLIQCRRTGEAPQLEDALRAVFPAKGGTMAKLRHEMSALLALLRGYLIEVEMEKTPLQRQLALLSALRKRGLEKNFQQAVREATALEPGAEAPAFSRNLFDFYLEKEKYEWDKRSRRHLDYPAETLASHLNAWYAGQLLQMACTEAAQDTLQPRAVPGEGMVGWTEKIVRELPSRPHENLPEIALYDHGLRLLRMPEDGEQSARFRALFEQHVHTLPAAEARELLKLAINHGIRRINSGDREAIRHTLGFYLFGLDQKLLQDENGRLSKYTYNNVLMTFLALEEWGRALEFLEQYRAQLPAKERDNLFRYNLAVYRFRKGEFDGALELLRNVNFPDPIYNLESRKMLLKIYYEQQAFDALESLLENLLTWLRRHREIGYQREMYRNLARFTGRLLRLPLHDREGARRLAQKVQDTPLVAERAWLLEKIKGR
jgi:hypothetical protein